jgi:hypothetical protein
LKIKKAGGKAVSPSDGLKIEKPEVELLNFPVSFIINIKTLTNMDPRYEVCFFNLSVFCL